MDTEAPTLEGRNIRLEPLSSRHREGLAEAIHDGELWQIPVTFVPHPADLDAFFDTAEAARRAGRELPFATIDKADGKVVGSTRFMEIDPTHRRLEIGFTFIRASRQRSHVNTEAKYLMLRHAFEALQVNRVQLLTDVLNDKSRRAIARIGAREEGVLRSHMVMRDGRVRDSVVFSMVMREWPAIRAALEAKLSAL